MGAGLSRFGVAALVFGLGSCAHDGASDRRAQAIVDGMAVTIEYTVRLEDQTLVGTTEGQAPFSYIHGRGEILRAVEAALTGLRPGDRRRVLVEADDAYGPYNEAKVLALPRNRFPPDVAVGGFFEDQIGRRMKVVGISEETVVVDWNHPLAGRVLIFDVKILDVQCLGPGPAPPQAP